MSEQRNMPNWSDFDARALGIYIRQINEKGAHVTVTVTGGVMVQHEVCGIFTEHASQRPSDNAYKADRILGQYLRGEITPPIEFENFPQWEKAREACTCGYRGEMQMHHGAPLITCIQCKKVWKR